MHPFRESVAESPTGSTSPADSPAVGTAQPEAADDHFVKDVSENEGLDYSIVSPAYAVAVSAGVHGSFAVRAA